jgi:predicted transcriptional regulator
MRRSKLEMYVDILRFLAQRGPMKVTHIMYKVNICYIHLGKYLEFLEQQELVERRFLSRERVVFAITPKGQTALNSFRQLVTTISNGERPYMIPELMLRR